MSHFAVCIITPAKPAEGEIEALLQPYHEFECTGISDQYVIDVDVTEEARATFDAETSTQLRGPDGTLHSPYDDQFYRDFTAEEREKLGRNPMGSGFGHGISFHSKDWGDGKGYRAKANFVPDGWTKVEVPTSEVESFAYWVAEYYGLERVLPGGRNDSGFVEVAEDGSVIRAVNRTNPNKHWDWWVMGGRYTGHLKMRDGEQGETGRPGVFGRAADAGTADQAAIASIDLDGMRDAAATRAAALWDQVHDAVDGLPMPDTWDEVTKDGFSEEARACYHDQPAIKAVRAAFPSSFMGRETDAIWVERDEWIVRARNGAITTFAMVKDGQWIQKGDMGWFGMSANEMTDEDWAAKFNAILDAEPPTSWLTIVDCHI